MSAPLRIGLAGYGFGGRRFHAPLLASAPECDFLGVVTTSAERQALVAEEHPGARTYASLAELRDGGAEAVAISTPAATHVPLAQEALRLGLAVVCDKPFALDAASARETVDLARSLAVPLSVYQNRREDSDLRTLRRLLAEGALGDLRRVESRFERFRPGSGPGEAGGGTLLDFGSHLVDQAHLLAGPVATVYAEVTSREGALDDDVFLALGHAGGVVSHLWGSWRQAAPGPRWRVTGSTGTWVLQGVDGQEDVLKAGGSPESEGERWGVEPEHAWGRLHRGEAGERVPSERGAWDLYYPAFAAAVRGEGPLPVEPEDAVATATVLDAARRSAVTGEVVRM